MTNVLIVEPEASGHHMALYVRLIVRVALQRGWKIHLLTTATAVKHPAFELVKSEASTSLKISFMEEVKSSSKFDVWSLLVLQNQYFQSISKAFRNIPKTDIPDIVYLVNLDYCDKIIALRGSPFGKVPFSGMMMDIKYHRAAMGLGPPARINWLYEKLFRRVLRLPTLHTATVIDEAFLTYIKRINCLEYRKIRFVPDVGQVSGTESRESARAALGFHADDFVILIYGSLTQRKGIHELLDAIDMPLMPKQVKLLVAGTPNLDIVSLLSNLKSVKLKKENRLIESLGFHDDTQEFRVFRSANLVWVGYVGRFNGSSGVLYQAGSLALPVIGNRSGLIGWLIQQHSLGLAVDPKNVQEVVNAVCNMYEDRSLRYSSGINGYNLAAMHTGEQYGISVCDAIGL